MGVQRQCCKKTRPTWALGREPFGTRAQSLRNKTKNPNQNETPRMEAMLKTHLITQKKRGTAAVVACLFFIAIACLTGCASSSDSGSSRYVSDEVAESAGVDIDDDSPDSSHGFFYRKKMPKRRTPASSPFFFKQCSTQGPSYYSKTSYFCGSSHGSF